MTKGRRPLIAWQEAARIAEKRGEVRQFVHGPDMICTFVIYLAGCVAHVRIHRVRRLRCTHAWIEREAADALITLRSIVSSPAISRELWICSPRGSYRFFRVLDTGLMELGRDGLPVPVHAPAPAQVQIPVPAAVPAKPVAGDLSSGENEK
jgi:hypothetical protein